MRDKKEKVTVNIVLTIWLCFSIDMLRDISVREGVKKEGREVREWVYLRGRMRRTEREHQETP